MASDYALGTTVYKTFTTRAFATGIPTVLADTPVVSAYENDSTSQITAGITLGVDHDGVVGLNLLTLVLTGANGYETDKDYNFVITNGKVDSVSVIGETVLSISIDKIPKGVWDRVLTGALHNISNSSGRRLRQLQEAGGYAGSIWIDTVDGVAGTTDFENGADTLPVDSIGDANTLAASLNLERFKVAPGSSITFAASQDNQSFEGEGWTLALGGQSIAGTSIRGADVSGTGTGAPHEFHDCHLAVCTFAGGEFKNCGLENTFTISAATIYRFTDCYHSEAGAPSTIDFGSAVGASEVHIHNWHGNLTILNMDTGDILHFTSSDGNLTMDSSNTAGTRNSSGTFGLTDNSTGMTVNDLGQAYQRIDTLLTTQLTEAYAADGVAPTLAQATFLIQQMLTDFVISGTTLTARKIDGAATAATFTLDDDTTPTSLTRAT